MTAPPSPPPSTRLPVWLARSWPFVLTAILAVLGSFLLQQALPRPPAPTVIVVTATSAAAPPAATSEPTLSVPTLTAVPTSSNPPINPTIAAQELGDLRLEDRSLWAALYLLRAANQLSDAESALQSNDLNEVERLSLIARASLDRAYAIAPERAKGPIDVLRGDLGRIVDDLRLRPDGSDRRLRDLRRLVVTLVDESL